MVIVTFETHSKPPMINRFWNVRNRNSVCHLKGGNRTSLTHQCRNAKYSAFRRIYTFSKTSKLKKGCWRIPCIRFQSALPLSDWPLSATGAPGALRCHRSQAVRCHRGGWAWQQIAAAPRQLPGKASFITEPSFFTVALNNNVLTKGGRGAQILYLSKSRITPWDCYMLNTCI